jgi:tetratricopeptide (TPR) repeat protein
VLKTAVPKTLGKAGLPTTSKRPVWISAAAVSVSLACTMDFCACSRASAADPASAFKRAEQEMEAKQYDQAIADYSEVIRLKPDYAAAYYNRGNAYYDLKQYDEAMADYSEVIRLKPDYAGGYNNRGNAHYDLKQYDQAIADYSEVIRLRPDYAGAYNNRVEAKHQPYRIAPAQFKHMIARTAELVDDSIPFH